MAQRPSAVTAEVTSVPDPTEIARVADFVREPFVTEGEDAATVLAPGSIRRHAFEAARAELDAGAAVPSQKWRRRWSLLLGLDRTLNATTPVLADGTTLNPHQIDALSGTYAALLADAQRRASGGSGSDGDALLLSFEDEDPTELEEPPARVTAEDDDGHDDEGSSHDEDDEDSEDGDLESLDDQLVELPDAEPESESALYDDVADEDVDEDIDRVALEDPNAHKRFWFEHATGAGKTVAAMGFVEACRTGGILILTHRRNLVDQFIDELRTRGYGERLSKPLLTDEDGNDPNPDVLGPVTIETYQWFVRNAGRISGAYTVVICDEAHTALGDKTSAAIRAWTGPIFIGMTATGALIARHVADLFPTQTSRFDLAQAARRGVIAPLRCLRIPPGPGVRTIAKVPLRKGEVDMEFDQEELAKLLDQAPFNLAIADLYKTRFRNTPGVVYAAGVEHAYNVAESFRALGMKAQAVSGETPKRELATILAQYDAGEIDVLINAQLLAEGWNSPRATICMHLAPTASKRIYQQRVGRVTRRHPGKEAGVVIDFVHPATPNDDPVVTLHSLLDRDVYRGGAIVVGPVRRGRGRRVKVERRVLPVTPNIERRRQVFERELWRIAVEQLDWGEQRVWAALAGAKASPANWRRGRAMLNFDRSGELRRQFLITALERNRSPQLRMRAIQEIALLREAEPFDTAIDFIGQWPRDERREASRTMLQAMADRRIGRRDQATAWIWRLAEYTRDVHEEYAAQRWPATKHLLGLLVNSSGAAHARNARRLVHGARQHDRRLQAALLAAAVAHTPEAEEVLREARTRLARKPGALSRDLLKDFPNGKRRKKRSRKRRGGGANGEEATANVTADGTTTDAEATEGTANGATAENGGNGNGQNGNGQNGNGTRSRRSRSRGGRRRNRGGAASTEASSQRETTPQADGDVQGQADAATQAEATPPADGETPTVPATGDATAATSAAPDAPTASEDAPPTRRRRVRGQKAAAEAEAEAAAEESGTATEPAAASADVESVAATPAEATPPARRTRTRKTAAEKAAEAAVDAAVDAAVAPADAAPVETPAATDEAPADKPVRRTRTRKTAAEKAAEAAAGEAAAPGTAATPVEAPAAEKQPARRPRKTAAQKAAEAAAVETADAAPAEKPVRATRTRKPAAQKAAEAAATEAAAPASAAETAEAPAKQPAARRTTTRKTAAQKAAEGAAAADAPAAAGEDAPDAAPAKKPAARRTTTRKTAAQKAAEGAAAGEGADAAEATPAKKPAARRTTTRKTAAQKAAADAAEAPAAAAASADAPAKKPAARRTTATKATAKTAATKTAAAKTTATKTTAAAKKPTTRKTAAQKAAEAAAATDEAPAKPATTRRTAAKTTTATKATTAAKATTSTAAKKPAARKTTTAKTAAAAKKPAATKASTAKTTTTRKTTTRRTTAAKTEEE